MDEQPRLERRAKVEPAQDSEFGTPNSDSARSSRANETRRFGDRRLTLAGWKIAVVST